MEFIQILFLANCLSIAMALKCTGMSSPKNLNSNEGNFSSPGWRRPLRASDACEWVLNIAGLNNNVVVKVNVEIDTISTNNCGKGGRLKMPDESTLCGKKPNRCIVYYYGKINKSACRQNVAKSSCQLVPLSISKWPLRFQYTQDANGRSKGFSLKYIASNCDSMVFPISKQETEQASRSTTSEVLTSRPLEPIKSSTTTMVIVVTTLAVVILLLVIAVLLVRYYKRSKTAPSQPLGPATDVGVYGSNGTNQTLYTAAEECEGGYDDSQLRQTPTPAPRTSSNAADTKEPTDTGYDDFKLKSKPKQEFHFYQEVRKKSSGAAVAVAAQRSEEAHTYEEVRRASSGVPSSRQVIQPPTDAYSYDT